MSAGLLHSGLWLLLSPDSDLDRETAIRLAKAALTKDPDKEHARIAAVKTERSFGRAESALKVAMPFADYTSLANPEYYDSLLAVGRFDDAIEHAEKNPLCDPLILGRAHVLGGNLRDAEHWFSQAIQEQPHGLGWINMANLAGLSGRMDTARQIITGIKRSTPEFCWAYARDRGRVFWGADGREVADLLCEGIRRAEQ